MKRHLVDDYRSWWSFVKNKGFVEVRVIGSSKYKKITMKNVSEFNAAVTLLNGPKAVFVDVKNGGLGTLGDKAFTS